VCERDDVDAAVKAAQRAAARWARTSIEKRQQAVVRYADALASQENDFATMLVREQGKPVRAIVKTSGRLALMAFEVFRSYL
jgi:acyl-CoA reductase-like NAD-dependent aldehyde dehydrogenase